MPILKYRCLDCGKEFSKIFFSEQNAPSACTVCQSANIVEDGNAFKYDEASVSRALCMSCDSCADDSCGHVRQSS